MLTGPDVQKLALIATNALPLSQAITVLAIQYSCRAVHGYTGHFEQVKKLARRDNEDGQQSTAKDKQVLPTCCSN